MAAKRKPIVFTPVGGIAKRLRPLTENFSKAFVRICNRPLIEFILAGLARAGMERFVFGIKGFHNYQCLYDHFGSGKGFSSEYGLPSIDIIYQPNIEDVGSADSLRINIEYYSEYFTPETPILVVQGDNLFNTDEIKDLIEFHEKKKAFTTIGLAPREELKGFGVVDIEKESWKIKRFVEKPIERGIEPPSNLVNTGIYLFDPGIKEVFKEKEIKQKIKKGRLDFGLDLLPWLVDKGFEVYGYVLRDKWYDVGTPQRYLNAMQGLLHGYLPLTDFYRKISNKDEIYVGGKSEVASSIRKNIEKKQIDSVGRPRRY